jgi:hypothetical protein
LRLYAVCMLRNEADILPDFLAQCAALFDRVLAVEPLHHCASVFQALTRNSRGNPQAYPQTRTGFAASVASSSVTMRRALCVAPRQRPNIQSLCWWKRVACVCASSRRIASAAAAGSPPATQRIEVS